MVYETPIIMNELFKQYNEYVKALCSIGDELKPHSYKDTNYQVCLAHVRGEVREGSDGGKQEGGCIP